MTPLTLPWIKTKTQWVTPRPFLMSLSRNLFIWEVSMKNKSKTIIQSSMLPNKHHMTCTMDIHQPALTGVFAMTHVPAHIFKDILSFPWTHQSNSFQPQDKALLVLSWFLWTQFKSKYAVLLLRVKASDSL